jgi:signal transduction histidine kinase
VTSRFYDFLNRWLERKPPRLVEESLLKIQQAYLEQKKLEEKKFLSRLPYIWVELSEEGLLQDFHPKAGEFLKIRLSQYLGRKLSPQIRDWELRNYFELFAQQPPVRSVVLIAEQEWLMTKVKRSSDKGPPNYFVFLEDRSAWRRLEGHRKEFVANVSHELRTPITVTKGSVETLLETQDMSAEEQRYFLELISRNTDHLMKSIDALILLARLEDDSRSLSMHPQSLSELLKEVLSWYEAIAAKKRVELLWKEPAQDEKVPMAASLMQKAIANLVDNAIKHNPAGTKVTVSLGRQDGEIYVSIADNGKGIPAALQKRVFERFFRVKGEKGAAVDGSGLGLALVKHIVDVHGGTCALRSEVDKGSEFFITFHSLDYPNS